jgi:peptide-methionine (S)-S-oxide reductase
MHLCRSLWLAIPLIASLAAAAEFPAPAVDVPASAGKKKETAVLAGGCFWGMEAVFDRLKGVSNVVSGYSGGEKSTAHYETVETGRTGHAESVKVTYDPAKISYGQLLEIFFAVAHDPTQLNRQGPDEGTQYRSVIFFESDDQKRVAEAYIEQLNNSKVFPYPIVTQVAPFTGFFEAEPGHQHYVAFHPREPYVVNNDLPKLKKLDKEFPDLTKHH